MDDLNEYRVFRAIAELGSLVRAASILQMPRSTVSKRLGDLERRLGETLFQRTTRRVVLTPAGRLMYERTAQALDLLAEGERALSNGRAGTTRTVVLSAPPVLAQNVIGSLVGELLRRHDNLRVDVRSKTDHDPDRDSDVDIRISAHPTNRPPAGARVVGYSRREIFAAPALLTKRTAALRIENLSPEEIIVRGPLEPLTLTRGRKRWTLICGAPLICIDHETVRDAVISGAFFGVLPRFIAAPAVAGGALVQVFGEWEFAQIPIAISVAPRAQDCAVVADIAELLPVALSARGLVA